MQLGYIGLGFINMPQKLNGTQTPNQCEAVRLGFLQSFAEPHFIRLELGLLNASYPRSAQVVLCVPAATFANFVGIIKISQNLGSLVHRLLLVFHMPPANQHTIMMWTFAIKKGWASMVYIPPPSTHTQTHTAAKYICLFRKNLIF
jgi:hypothetical protein